MTVEPPIFGQDPEHAAWLGPRLTGGWGRVGGVVPVGFEAYARILHPVDGEEGPGGQEGAARSWADIADETGTTMHALVQWNRIQPIRSSRSDWISSPDEGNLPTATLRRLLDALARHTVDPDSCWFCLWDGYGWVRGGSAVVTMTVDGSRPAAPTPPASPS